MDYHLDRKVVLSEESEFKSLYSWSLQEFDEEGKQIGRSQIPWQWNLWFTAKEVTYHDTLRLIHKFEKDSEQEPWDKPREKRLIKAKLGPGRYYEEPSDETSYSMFGTGRHIKDFELFIMETDKAEDVDNCRLWGTVSFTTELDFRDETTDDAVQIYLHVDPIRFKRYIDNVRLHPSDILSVRLSGVSGFYSEWSPSISTDKVKVLADLEDQKVALPDGTTIKPPVLGFVDEVDLDFITVRELPRSAPMEADVDDNVTDDDDDPWRQQPTAEDESLAIQQSILKLIQPYEKLLSGLRFGIWVVAILLFLLLLRS